MPRRSRRRRVHWSSDDEDGEDEEDVDVDGEDDFAMRPARSMHCDSVYSDDELCIYCLLSTSAS